MTANPLLTKSLNMPHFATTGFNSLTPPHPGASDLTKWSL
jgi:hypothetical protein